MKKIILIFMAIILTFSAAACGGETTQNETNPAATTEPTVAEVAFVPQRSTFDQATSTFYNEQTGITCTIPEGWYKFTEEYIANMMFGGISAEELAAMTPEEFSQMEIVTDFMVCPESEEDVLSIGICNGALVYPEVENPADTYGLSIYAMAITKGEVFAEEKIMLSGQEFNLISVKTDDCDYHYAYRSIDSNYVLYLVYTTKGDFRPEMVWDMFNGGIKTASPENVPSRHVYDADYNRLINENTGMIVDVPSDWNSATHNYVAELFYDADEAWLNSLTPEDWTQYQHIYDMALWNSADTAEVSVYYVNTRLFGGLYGATDDEMYQIYLDTYTDDENYTQFAYENEDITLCGRTFKVIDVFYTGDDYRHMTFAYSRLNDDYLIMVECNNYDEENYVDFWSMFERNNDDGKISDFIRPSSYDEATRHFYNEYTGVGLTVPKGWTVLDDSHIYDVLYESAKPGDFDNYTDEDYNDLWAVPDFSIADETADNILFVYYENLNLCGEFYNKPDIYEYYDYQKQIYEASGWTITNETGYILAGYEVMVLSVTKEDASIIHIGFAQVNDDYMLVMMGLSDNPDDYRFWRMLDETSPERLEEILAMYE